MVFSLRISQRIQCAISHCLAHLASLCASSFTPFLSVHETVSGYMDIGHKRRSVASNHRNLAQRTKASGLLSRYQYQFSEQLLMTSALYFFASRLQPENNFATRTSSTHAAPKCRPFYTPTMHCESGDAISAKKLYSSCVRGMPANCFIALNASDIIKRQS